MKLHHLHHFVAVATYGSLHRASAAIGVAQSALSRSLSELEASLGTTLVERSRRGSVLTEAGKRFLVRARSIQEELRRSQEEAQQHEGGKGGQVTLAMSPTAQLLVLPRLMRRFRRTWPAVQVTILEGLAESFEGALLDGSVDFYVGICPLRPLDRAITRSAPMPIERVIVSGADSHWRDATSLRALSEAPWIRIRSDDQADELSALFEAHALPVPPQTCLASSMLSIFLLIGAIDALALVPRSWPELSPAANLFAPVRVGESLGTLDLCTMHRAGLPLTPAAQAMLDYVGSVLRQGG